MSLGNNYGSSSFIRVLILKYKMDLVAGLESDSEEVLKSIARSRYAESTKQKAYKECAKYKEYCKNKKPC